MRTRLRLSLTVQELAPAARQGGLAYLAEQALTDDNHPGPAHGALTSPPGPRSDRIRIRHYLIRRQ